MNIQSATILKSISDFVPAWVVSTAEAAASPEAIVTKVGGIATSIFSSFTGMYSSLAFYAFDYGLYTVKILGASGLTIGAVVLPLLAIRLVTGKMLSSSFSTHTILLEKVEDLLQPENGKFKRHVLSRIYCIAGGAFSALDAVAHAIGAVGKLGLFTFKVVALGGLALTILVLSAVQGYAINWVLGQNTIRQLIRIVSVSMVAMGNFVKTFQAARMLYKLWISSFAGLRDLILAAKSTLDNFSDITFSEVSKHTYKSFACAISAVLSPGIGFFHPKKCIELNVKYGLKEIPAIPRYETTLQCIWRNISDHSAKVTILTALAVAYSIFPTQVENIAWNLPGYVAQTAKAPFSLAYNFFTNSETNERLDKIVALNEKMIKDQHADNHVISEIIKVLLLQQQDTKASNEALQKAILQLTQGINDNSQQTQAILELTKSLGDSNTQTHAAFTNFLTRFA